MADYAKGSGSTCTDKLGDARIVPGTVVLVGCHRAVCGEYDWHADMNDYVGMRATVTKRLSKLSVHECAYVALDVDNGTFCWRVRDLVYIDQAKQDALEALDTRRSIGFYAHDVFRPFTSYDTLSWLVRSGIVRRGQGSPVYVIQRYRLAMALGTNSQRELVEKPEEAAMRDAACSYVEKHGFNIASSVAHEAALECAYQATGHYDPTVADVFIEELKRLAALGDSTQTGHYTDGDGKTRYAVDGVEVPLCKMSGCEQPTYKYASGQFSRFCPDCKQTKHEKDVAEAKALRPKAPRPSVRPRDVLGAEHGNGPAGEPFMDRDGRWQR